MLVVPAWLVYLLSHALAGAVSIYAYRFWLAKRPVQYMKIQAGLDADGNPTLQEPIYWNDETVAMNERFGPHKPAPISGLDDGH